MVTKSRPLLYMLVVGLTGGIASGKSTVSQTLAQKYRFTVVDADKIAKEVVLPGTKCYRKITETFGEFVDDLIDTSNEGRLNNAALGSAVFGNKENLRKLNSIVHPAVRREIFKQILKAYLKLNSLVILDVPLLFESGLHRFCGAVVTVACHDVTQMERLRARNPELTPEQAQKRIDSQMSTFERIFKLDVVIENNGTLDQLKASIDEAVTEIRPTWLWTILDWFPPIALALAICTILLSYLNEVLRGVAPQNTHDD